MDWGQLFLQPQWLTRIDKLAERRFGAGGLAEEASSYVLEALSADNWSRCQQFKGNSRPETYIYTLANNALEEFSRRRFGRMRPPEWLKREGPTWVELWKRLCMERQLDDTVLDSFSASGRELAIVREMVRTIKARMPWCGSSAQEIPVIYYDNHQDEEVSAADNLAWDDDAAERARQSSYEILVLALSYLLDTPQNSSERAALEQNAEDKIAQLAPVFDQLSATIALSDEERLVLSMVYRDGMKKNQVAAALGLHVHQPGRILTRVFDRIASAFSASGFNLDVLSAQESQSA